MSLEFDSTVKYINCGSDATLDNLFSGGGSVAYWMLTSIAASTVAGTKVTPVGKYAASSAGWIILS